MPLTVNLDKAKAATHNLRRQARSVEFKPHDDIIMKQIPGPDLTQAEAARQAIRDKYAAIQNEIDVATTVEALELKHKELYSVLFSSVSQ